MYNTCEETVCAPMGIVGRFVPRCYLRLIHTPTRVHTLSLTHTHTNTRKDIHRRAHARQDSVFIKPMNHQPAEINLYQVIIIYITSGLTLMRILYRDMKLLLHHRHHRQLLLFICIMISSTYVFVLHVRKDINFPIEPLGSDRVVKDVRDALQCGFFPSSRIEY